MTGGVVRRDGLREAVTALCDEMQQWGEGPGYKRVNCTYFAGRLRAVLDAVPYEPPDPPAADEVGE